MKYLFKVKYLKELDIVAEKIIEFLSAYKIVTFSGDLGVGKTTLIKVLCKKLGTNDLVTSPTFSLVNKYNYKETKSIYHFDFYRIKNIEEVYDIGYEEYFFSNSVCLIEWPEKARELIPNKSIKVEIIIKNSQRIINIALKQ